MGSSSDLYNLSNGRKKKFTWSYLLCALIVALVIISHFYYNQSININSLYNSNSVSQIDPYPYPYPFVDAPSQDSDQKIIVTFPAGGLDSNKTTTCDYSKGEWVPTNLEPLYNGTTCGTIKQGQNCVVFGRPDREYLHWKWKPQECDLPRFDPNTFLNLMKDKHVAFVGDSLARNQLESLLCLIATVSKPNLTFSGGDDNRFRKWHLPSHNINVSIYWSPFLVKGIEHSPDRQNFNTLYLDKVDERWAGDLSSFDMLVMASGQWYLLSAVFHYEDQVLGCHILDNCTEIGFYDVYGKALKTAFQAIVQRRRSIEHSLDVFLTTFPPAHFEGDWDKLGSCSKTKPYKAGEEVLQGANAEMRRIGVDKVDEAQQMFKEGRVRFKALDVTELSLLRPDGHPGPYMIPFPFKNGVSDRVQNDCVHWCLPGPIDTWNEILLQMIKNNRAT
ncbi:xyloglucan O-acetyltransferase 1 [Andrographis paniculata]|uniref:xyloglucan O-acetyltransferase 1 n=1 Tax=Andrographis paniculata TaxID=175694 RepID=UPI0021E7F51A|nr:xyloglucan O-acetyltransferase 1 [Andrographis paniculata]